MIQNIIKLLEFIYQRCGDEIGERYWEDNKIVLEKRYPEVAERVERLIQEERIGVRPYGLRGKVVGRKQRVRFTMVWKAAMWRFKNC